MQKKWSSCASQFGPKAANCTAGAIVPSVLSEWKIENQPFMQTQLFPHYLYKPMRTYEKQRRLPISMHGLRYGVWGLCMRLCMYGDMPSHCSPARSIASSTHRTSLSAPLGAQQLVSADQTQIHTADCIRTSPSASFYLSLLFRHL